MSSTTRRKYIRIEIMQQVTIEFRDVKYTSCYINNLSLTGMLVTGILCQQEGDECVVSYTRTCNTSNHSFQIKARIARTTEQGIGLEFLAMPPDDYMQLQTALLYEAADPLAVVLELPDECPFDITAKMSGDIAKSFHTRVCCH